MAKINKHIKIVRSTIKRLSSMSQVSCDALQTLLSKHYEKVSVHIVNNLHDLKSLVRLNPDLAFMGMQSIPRTEGIDDINSPKIWLSKYLDDNGIPYTGSEHFAHKLGNNKAFAKQQVLNAGLNTSNFFITRQSKPIDDDFEALNFPMFVKPLDRGGGLGIDSLSVVHNFKQLKNKVGSITANFGSDSIVEEYLDGREFSVAVLEGSAPNGFLAMPLELSAPKDEFGARMLSGSVKSDNTEDFTAVADKELREKLSELAIDIFLALGARDYGRIDIRLDSSGVPQFLEANLIPSIIEGYGSFPKACLLNKNLNYESMILRIVNLAFAREEQEELIAVSSMPAVAVA